MPLRAQGWSWVVMARLGCVGLVLLGFRACMSCQADDYLAGLQSSESSDDEVTASATVAAAEAVRTEVNPKSPYTFTLHLKMSSL